MTKVREVQTKSPVVLQVHDATHLVQVTRFAIGCESHHLVFIAVVRESQVLGHRLIKNSQGMRKIDFALDVYPRATPDAPGSAREIPKAVHGDGKRFVKRRDQEGRGEMRKMVL